MNTDIESLLQSAREARNFGRRDDALATYGYAADMARTLGEERLLAHALRHLSDLYRHTGDPNAAEATGREAITFYRRHARTRPLDLANALRVRALALQDLNRGDEATPLWREARNLYTEADIVAGIEECDGNLA